MYLTIDTQKDQPIYEQIYRQIVLGIGKGNLQPGEGLPSVRQMAEQLGVNMHTILKTYQLLKDHGYITMDRRIGAAVRSPLPEKDPSWMEEYKEEFTYLVAQGLVRGLSEEELQEILSRIVTSFKGGL